MSCGSFSARPQGVEENWEEEKLEGTLVLQLWLLCDDRPRGREARKGKLSGGKKMMLRANGTDGDRSYIDNRIWTMRVICGADQKPQRAISWSFHWHKFCPTDGERFRENSSRTGHSIDDCGILRGWGVFWRDAFVVHVWLQVSEQWKCCVQLRKRIKCMICQLSIVSVSFKNSRGWARYLDSICFASWSPALLSVNL